MSIILYLRSKSLKGKGHIWINQHIGFIFKCDWIHSYATTFKPFLQSWPKMSMSNNCQCQFQEK
jgi:hypothetical protein